MPEEQSLSIEETNKLRISLGLKPLQVDPVPSSSTTTNDAKTPGATTEDAATGFDAEERLAVTNWQKRQDELEKVAFRAQQREDIRKAKDAARRFAKLDGVGLGDEAVDGEEDAVEWVRKMKKRQRKIARKMAEELAARDGDGKVEEYGERDVRGLKVAHDAEDFMEGMGEGEGEGVVLTLKDATIDELEEEGDELENVQLGERERLRKNLEVKKKKKAYDAFEEDVDEHGERKILGQYDEEIDPKKGRKNFTLGGVLEREGRVRGDVDGGRGGGGADADSAEARREAMKEKLKLAAISLDSESMYPPPHIHIMVSVLANSRSTYRNRTRLRLPRSLVRQDEEAKEEETPQHQAQRRR